MVKIGDLFDTNSSGLCEVVKYLTYDNVVVKFIETGYLTRTSVDNLKRGKVKDRMVASVYGVGVLGSGCENKQTLNLWKNMLRRCYGKNTSTDNPTYLECTVSDQFKRLDYFSEWCHNQIGFGRDGWELDKDILIKGNRVYSSEGCCFVPNEINMVFVKRKTERGDYPIGVNYHKKRKQFRARCSVKGLGVHLGWFTTPEDAFNAYKAEKEKHIKVLANKWKDQIDIRVYEALMNYQVEITD